MTATEAALRATAFALALSVALPCLAGGASSDGIPQFLKAGDCNAFWVPGPNGAWQGAGTTLAPLGQWYAIAGADLPLPASGADYNRVGRWAEVVEAAATGRELWITSPATVGVPVANNPETVMCSVPPPGGGFGGALPNAIIYTFPPNP